LRNFAGYGRYPIVIGNLIFHHLDDTDLAAFGAELRRSARVILACEPGRSRASQIAFRIFGTLLRANRVTLHDAAASIDAGFRDSELAKKLGLAAADWEVRCSVSLIGAYHLVAVRRPSP
jgi:hypothetical protein